MKKDKHQEDISLLKQRIKQGSLAPEVKKKLAALSQELGMPEVDLAQLCVMMYRLYGNKT